MAEIFDGDINWANPLAWQERIASNSRWSGQVSYDKAAFSYELQVPWAAFPVTCIKILGYSALDGVRTDRLSRVGPLRHPIFPNLAATSITGIQGIGMPKTVNGVGSNDLYGVGPITPTVSTELQPLYARNKLVKMTINFEPLPYGTLNDTQINTTYNPIELQRYTSFVVKPGNEILSIDGHSYKFTCGPGMNVTGVPGNHFTLFSPRSTFEITWWRVPLEFVTVAPSTSGFRIEFRNIEDCIGRCNSTEFLGYKRGELLLDPPLIRQYANPFPPSITVPSTTPQFLCDITYPFRAYTPEYGTCSDDTTTMGVNESWNPSSPSTDGRYGWQTAPWRGDFKHYPIVLAKAGSSYPDPPANKPPYREAEFKNLFKKAV